MKKRVRVKDEFQGHISEQSTVLDFGCGAGHLSNPFEVLNELKTKIKSGGVIFFSIPHEILNRKFKPPDINNKFSTWSPMAIGNLFLEVGFQIIEVKVFKEISFPKEMYI